jgi:tetratricopeptide (TPR) repeat protein
VVGWEGSDPIGGSLTAADPEPLPAGAPADEKARWHMRRFMARAVRAAFEGMREGALREASVELEEILKLRPELATVRMNLHWVLAKLAEQKRADDLLAASTKEPATHPQALCYFARQLNQRKDYDGALRLLEAARPISDYLGDEIGLERTRAAAGKLDVTGVVGAFEKRIEELEADLDHFHYAYHIGVAVALPTGEIRTFFQELAKDFLAVMGERAAKPDAKSIYTINLSWMSGRFVGPDAQAKVLADAVPRLKHVFGFRHYFYKASYRILETGEPDFPD